MTTNKPLIGITADRMTSGAHPCCVVHQKYVDPVVDAAQGLAMVVPPLGERQPSADLLPLLDGLLFTGSYSNVEPHWYGGAPSAPGTLHDPARDATTLPLLRAAIDAGVPVLAICRGFQEMNVVFGGTLHQRVQEVPGLADHREDRELALELQYGPAHAVHLATGGLLARLAGRHEVSVNSLHGQGIDRLGEGLRIEARAPDGLIEAIGVDGAPVFALGLQWHPEWRHAENPLSTAIFRAFGEACRERRRRRG